MQKKNAPDSWNSIKEVLGPEGWKETVRMFREDAAAFLIQTREEIAAGQWPEAAATAHKLAGLAAALQCVSEQRLAQNLEVVTRLGKKARAQTLLPQVERAFQGLRERLARG